MIVTPAPRKLAIVMVGLPARGKTYTARKVARYLSWLGYRTRVFNVGSYRRERLGARQPHTFFDPANEAATLARMETAGVALDDAVRWLSDDGDVVIYDATNSSSERRRMLRARFEALGADMLFLESVCHDASIVELNIRQTKAHSPDYAGTDPEEAMRDFRARLAHYEKTYEEVREAEGPFVKIIDVGRTVVAHRIEGYLQARLVYFLLNLHIEPRSIWLTRHGESEFNEQRRIGGDTALTPLGRVYAARLSEFVHEQVLPDGPLTIWTSTMKRTIETAQPLRLPFTQWRALDEIEAGRCDGLTYDEIAERMPEESLARSTDKFRYRYPRGESYQDVIRRLEPVIMALERERSSVLIVGHQAVLRALYAYQMDHPAELCPTLPIPLHSVIRLTPTAYGCDEQRTMIMSDPGPRDSGPPPPR